MYISEIMGFGLMGIMAFLTGIMAFLTGITDRSPTHLKQSMKGGNFKTSAFLIWGN